MKPVQPVADLQILRVLIARLMQLTTQEHAIEIQDTIETYPLRIARNADNYEPLVQQVVTLIDKVVWLMLAWQLAHLGHVLVIHRMFMKMAYVRPVMKPALHVAD